MGLNAVAAAEPQRALSALEPDEDPAAARRSTRSWWADPVLWTAGLYLTTFLIQRISVPNLPVPITLGVAVAWLVLTTFFGIVEVNRGRLLLWLGASGVSGLMVMLQLVVLADPFISFNSWALWIVTWLPLVVQLRERDTSTYLRFARTVAYIGVGLSALSLAFIGSQLAGLRYYDWVGRVVPANLLVPDYAISYPIVYGSQLYKSNGWIALEPSFMSFYIGVATICALLARVRIVWVAILIAGLFSTVAGSGLALLAVFLLATALQGRLGYLRRYLIPGAAIFLLASFTVLGEAVFGRIGEAGQQNSSTSLRAIDGYVRLWQPYITDPVGIFTGHGPGSSTNVLNSLGIEGLLVPTIAKLLFEYGLLGGLMLLALMVSTYLRGPSAAFALSLAASMFVLQGAAQPLVICSVVAISLWSPAPGLRDTLPGAGRRALAEQAWFSPTYRHGRPAWLRHLR